MNTERFDAFTRALATGVSLWQMLKMLAGAVIGGVLFARESSAGAGMSERAAMSGGAAAPECMMPTSSVGCVRIGGGPRPFYYEGWVCPASGCHGGYCAGKDLGGSGRCTTAAEVRDIVSSGEGRVLEGSLP
jgi:hypothetical protein